ncbi:MAG: hypothetical protein DWQ19_09115 [Crenarchaeota archaeon]|nr:MAG: hypothetical protein DWQ19_09115 [Thermoproteota archaeon]
MSTRCNIEIHDTFNVLGGGEQEYLGALLYHHSDGYPGFMDKKLHKFLKATYKYLEKAGHPYWWDSERVAAVMILLSTGDYEAPTQPALHSFDVPQFQPSLKLHDDIDYIWKVVLKLKGQYEIYYRRPSENWTKVDLIGLEQ